MSVEITVLCEYKTKKIPSLSANAIMRVETASAMAVSTSSMVFMPKYYTKQTNK